MKRALALLVFLLLALASLTPESSFAEDDASRLSFSGDIRGRWGGFWFKEDYDGSKKDPRARIRYRLRLNGKAKISDHGSFAMQIGTGDLDHRSGNQTLGSPVDFGPNEFDIRRAYLTINPWADGKLPGREGSWAFQFGRIPNPLLWKEGPDKLLWDSDINFSGASTTFDIGVGGSGNLWANLAYAVIDENSGDDDPYMGAVQAGIKGAGDDLKGGIRGTFYTFAQLDSAFIKRGVDGTGAATSSAGNIRDGLTGDPDGGQFNVVETKAFLRFTWANLLLTGTYSANLDAQASEIEPGIGKENLAYSFGGSIGDRKKNVLVAAGYYAIEANAFPSQFIDSDILDGVTNRKGFVVAAARQIWPKSTLGLTVLNSSPVNEDTKLASSIKGSKRTRVQVDLDYKF